MINPKYFPSPIDFKKWFDENHESAQELWVGFYKVASGIPSITWPQSVDEALCVGWIDGKRMSIDDKSYMIRFTPRRSKSHWSNVNINRVAELKKSGLMKATGLAAFNRRDKNESGKASYEQARIRFSIDFEEKIKTRIKAWNFFNRMSPSQQKNSIWWVMSAKREDTRLRRFNILVKSSEARELIPQLGLYTKKKS